MKVISRLAAVWILIFLGIFGAAWGNFIWTAPQWLRWSLAFLWPMSVVMSLLAYVGARVKK